MNAYAGYNELADEMCAIIIQDEMTLLKAKKAYEKEYTGGLIGNSLNRALKDSERFLLSTQFETLYRYDPKGTLTLMRERVEKMKEIEFEKHEITFLNETLYQYSKEYAMCEMLIERYALLKTWQGWLTKEETRLSAEHKEKLKGLDKKEAKKIKLTAKHKQIKLNLKKCEKRIEKVEKELQSKTFKDTYGTDGQVIIDSVCKRVAKNGTRNLTDKELAFVKRQTGNFKKEEKEELRSELRQFEFKRVENEKRHLHRAERKR